MKIKILTALILIMAIACSSMYALNPRKKLNSINCAKLLAERNIVETVYGVKLKYDEEVTDLINGSFHGVTETKTGKRKIVGIEFEPYQYDANDDIAMVTATLKISRLKNIIDTNKFNLESNPDKEFKRVAFATSTLKNAPKIAALRAAEIDAYKNLYKQIGGFTLESHTKVENFVLKSDKVKASVIGALMGAEFVGFRWEGTGNDAIAIVKMRINMKELEELLGQKLIDFNKVYLDAEGMAAQQDEDEEEVTSTQNITEKASTPQVETEVVTNKVMVLP